MREIIIGDKILARYITSNDIKDGLNFFSRDEEFIQVGVWGNYEAGKILNAHVHNLVERKIDRTYEVLFVISGAVEADIYTLDSKLADKLILKQGEILILLECGHGYKVLEENTRVLEVKNGPYMGADIDRRRI